MSATALVLLSSGLLAIAATIVALLLARRTLLGRGRLRPPAGAAPAGPDEGQREAERARNLLLIRMSHDLRSPLNSVVTLSELLREGNAGPLSVEQARYVDVIHHSAETLRALVNDILDLAAIEAGRLELELGVVDLAALVGAVADAAVPIASDKGIPVQVRAPERRLLARTDEQHLRQILQRLVEHAIGATRNGYVEITALASRDHRSARLSVHENTPALAEEERRALADGDGAFDDFVAGEGSFSGRGPAALPLVIAARLARQMGLHIVVETSPDDDGVSFELELPLSSVGTAAAVAGGAVERPVIGPAPGRGSGRVLLIEDDSLERRRAGVLLEAAGYGVTLAASGDEGLALLRDGRFDAVVLDLVMPGMSGLDVLRAARADERLAALPFVVLSALYMTKNERDVLGPNVAAVMRKGDATGEALVEAVGRAMATPLGEIPAPPPGDGGGRHA